MIVIVNEKEGNISNSCHKAYTELPKYYARIQTAVVRGFGLPAGRLAGRHTDAAPQRSLCYIIQFPRRWSFSSTYIYKAETLAFINCDYY